MPEDRLFHLLQKPLDNEAKCVATATRKLNCETIDVGSQANNSFLACESARVHEETVELVPKASHVDGILPTHDSSHFSFTSDAEGLVHGLKNVDGCARV